VESSPAHQLVDDSYGECLSDKLNGVGRFWSSSLQRAWPLAKILINFAHVETIYVTVHPHVVSYDYDHNLVVLVITIGGLLIIEAQILMNARHYCVDYCVYSTAIDRHHEMMDRFRRHHHHQAHRSILRADYPGHLVRELGHVLIRHCRCLMVDRSDQI
jgi:hypothetical protein